MTTQWSVSPQSELAVRRRPRACRQVCSTTLIILAPPCSAALAAGRLARRPTILLSKSSLSHSDRLGSALCAWPGPASLLCPSLLLVRFPLSAFPAQILLSTCLLAFRNRVLISSVTISCQLSLRNSTESNSTISLYTDVWKRRKAHNM